MPPYILRIVFHCCCIISWQLFVLNWYYFNICVLKNQSKLWIITNHILQIANIAFIRRHSFIFYSRFIQAFFKKHSRFFTICDYTVFIKSDYKYFFENLFHNTAGHGPGILPFFFLRFTQKSFGWPPKLFCVIKQRFVIAPRATIPNLFFHPDTRLIK